MKKLFYLILFSAMHLWGMRLTPHTALPNFCLADSQGIVHRLQDYRGKKLIIFFFSFDEWEGKSGFSYNAQHIYFLKKMYHALQTSSIEMVGVVDKISGADLADYKKRNEIMFPLLIADHNTALRYGIAGFNGSLKRTTFVLDEQGFVLMAVQHICPKIHIAETLVRLFESCYEETVEKILTKIIT